MTYKWVISMNSNKSISLICNYTSWHYKLQNGMISHDTGPILILLHIEATWQVLIMMTSSETFSALLVICAGNLPVPGEFPTQRPVTRSFYVFFDLRPNKRLRKHRWGWWFETPLCPLWRHCNDYNISGSAHMTYYSDHPLHNGSV